MRIRPQKRVEDDAQLLAHIEMVHDDSKGRYGSPRVYRELRATGVRCSRHRVARLMRAAGRRGRGKRRSKSTTDSGHALPVAENLLMRQFEVAEPNLMWAADMTFIRTTEGWLYLAVVLDLVVPQDSVERLGGGCKRSGTYPELACLPTGLKRSGDGGKAVPISIQPCRAGDDRRS